MTIPCLFNSCLRYRTLTSIMSETLISYLCGYVPKLKASNDPSSCLCNCLCNTNYAHLTGNTWEWEESASNFPNKAFYYHRQTGYSLLFIRFVFFSQCLLGWTVCKAGIIRDGTVTGTHLIWRSLVHDATHTPDITHRHGHTCLRTQLQALVIFALPPV